LYFEIKKEGKEGEKEREKSFNRIDKNVIFFVRFLKLHKRLINIYVTFNKNIWRYKTQDRVI